MKSESGFSLAIASQPFSVFQYQEKDEEVTGMKNIQIKSFELANFGKNTGEKM